VSSIAELRLMAQVARMYYEQNLNQSTIASRLDLSQATVSRLIKRAQAEHIVRITVSMPAGIYPDLEETLRQKYDLKDAIVVDCHADDDEQMQRDIGAAAAYYLEMTVKKHEVIGISSWSATLLAMVDAMHPLVRPMDATALQILGGIGNPSAEVHANRLTDRLAKLVHGTAVFLPAPGVTHSADARTILLQDQYVTAATQLFDQVTLALVGIGDVEPSKLLASSGNVFSSDELELLRAGGAVGDICLRFFDSEGTPVETPLNDRVIGMELEQLRSARRSVGIAGGQRKITAIRAALQGRWINVLITDYLTAQRLVEDETA
jgi:DNA-binding transcriptional regulator LsrR (DeoR family)